LFRLSPERAQRLAESALRIRPVWRTLSLRLRVSDPVLRRTFAGIHLENPIGLAAGFDKQCQHLDTLGHLGFGYVVGGTVTPEPRPGNPRPRLLRETSSQSLINSMGFPSDGLEVVADQMRRFGHLAMPVLVSIAALDPEGFERCHQTLEPLVDALEMNISSPNTQGIRRFQVPDEFRALLQRMNVHRRKPLFVKLPPYTDEQGREQVAALLNECIAAGVTGVTAINTLPVEDSRLAMGRGGLSGRAIFPDMLRVVRDLRQEAGDKLFINACGGISTGEEAWQALQAGADTVQIYTALVYNGPSVVHTIATELAQLMKAAPADVRYGPQIAEQQP
jgi:dihydroorotate dehydrogenase subfamily 2